jgi:predicted nucleic acid-binding protein
LVFDTEALLSFYLGEPGGKKVEAYLEAIMRGESVGYLNVFNFCELYYIMYRKSSAMAAEKEQNLRGYGLRIVSVADGDGLWREAARIKATHTLSLADAFAAATAKVKNCTLIIGQDAEFADIEGVKVERVR